MKKDSSQLTIILPLYKRPEYTHRFLSHLAKQNCQYDILLADGSFDKETHRLIIESFNDKLSLIHKDFDRDNSFLDYFKKIISSLKEIETPYIFFADNDDLINVGRFQKAIDFLNSNTDYNLCSGRLGYFFINQSSKNNLDYCTVHSMRSECDIEKALPLERIDKNMKHYSSNFYMVQRRKPILEAYEKQVEMNLNDIFLSEVFTSNYVLASGKQKILNSIFYLRQLNTIDSVARTNDIENTGLLGRFFKPTWSQDFEKYLKGLKSSPEIGEDEDTQKQLIQSYYSYTQDTLYLQPSLLQIIISKARSRKFPLFRLTYLLESWYFIISRAGSPDFKFLMEMKKFIKEYGCNIKT